MKQGINGLTIENQYFHWFELEKFCENAIAGKTEPDWKMDVYRFILDFISDSAYILQQTSGSTGTPKTIQLSKQAILKSAENTIEFFNLGENQKAVLCLPGKYIAGKMMIVRAFLAEMNLILIEPASLPDFSNLGKIDFCAMVPMQAAKLLEQNKWPDIKALILGGSETNPELAEKLQSVETEVFETYGMAETCSHIALKRINGKNPEEYFTTLPGIKISLDNRDCLEIEAAFLNEKIITNDIVELVSENNFNWIGRFDTIINSGGIKIQPEILEKQTTDILQKPCVILGKPDELLGQKVVLIIESEPEDPKIIFEKLAPFIDKKMLPKTILFMKSLPRNKSFKIDRAALNRVI